MEYRYDDQGYPLGKNHEKVTTKHYLSAPRHQRIRSKKLDYTAVTLLNNQRVGNVKTEL
ncbi:YnfC family lipoprotein [Escherichia coli]